jgi:hypothetical protein
MKNLLIILLCFPLLSLAQSTPNLLRSTISNSGSSIETINKKLVQQSIGQSGPLGLQEVREYTIRQGFIQPAQLKLMIASSNVSDLSVDIYPNPTNNKITLSFDDLNTGKVKLCIYDQMGKLVMEDYKEWAAELSYSLIDLSFGNYYLKVNTSTKEYITQISKQ